MKENLQAYFNFTKKERTGIAIVMMVILIVAVAPAFFPGGPVVSDSTQLTALRKQVLLFDAAVADSPLYSGGRKYAYRNAVGYDANEKRGEQPGPDAIPFPFDPNTLDVEGWKKLGVREKTALTVQKYLAKGGRFRQPDDLLRIYGLPDDTKRRLLPYVRIVTGVSSEKVNPGRQHEHQSQNYENGSPAQAAGAAEQYGQRRASTESSGSSKGFYHREPPKILDINLADTNAFRSLPGIGPVLSRRIVQFREKLGGFYAKEQLSEVYGIHDTTYQKIAPYLTCTPDVVKLNLNTADQQALDQHPYFRRQVARAIIAFRQQHGQFSNLQQLRGLVTVTNEVYMKLIVYATL